MVQNQPTTPSKPAEPSSTVTETVTQQVAGHVGRSLREHFAGLALQGLLAGSRGWPDTTDMPEIARRARIGADALIAELARGAE